MSYTQQIKIGIVDDHNLFRKGLIKLINAINDSRYFIVLEAESGKDLMAKIDRKALPDIIIMDIEMPDMGGFDAVRWLQEHHPDINILVISMVETEEAIVRMIKLGVKGYLSKDIETSDLAAALRSISNKKFHYTDFITGKLIHSIIRADENDLGDKLFFSLSEREREFIRHACSEMTYDEIASHMHVSPRTVDNYRESVFKKTKVKTRVSLALFAVKHKLVTI